MMLAGSYSITGLHDIRIALKLFSNSSGAYSPLPCA